MTVLLIIILMGSLCTITIVASALYFQLGFFARFFHDILRWHTPDPKIELEFGGCSMRGVCRHCKKSIIQDSQGNWFVEDNYVR